MSRSPDAYSRLQIALHWGVAVLIAIAWFSHEDMGRTLRDRIEAGTTGLDGATVHTVAGGLVLLFVLWRLAVRLKRGAPEPSGSPAVVTAAHWGHRALYFLMLAVPALGAAAWYGHLRDLGEIHEIAAQVLMLTVLGHIAMAIWHEAVKKDGTMRRMVRPNSGT